MAEDKLHIDFPELIAKYLSGEASDPEVKQLEAWVMSSPENKALFVRFKKAWMLAGIEGNYQSIDVEKEWKSTAGQLFAKGKVIPITAKQRRPRGFYLSIAAAAALLMVALFWLFKPARPADFHEFASKNLVEESQLPDGTQISLNQYSSVRFLTKPGEKYRRAELTGDAFFKVERDTARPFVITTQNVEIEVLGTSFYVDSRENQLQILVIVESGSVAISSENDRLVLASNETGIYERSSGQLTKKQNDDVNFLAWKTNVLVFDNTSLEQVVFDLNRKFHAQVSIANPELNACKLTATYDHQSLEAIVRIIEKTLNIKAETDGETIVFSGQRCD